jgi:hypothetical protein
MYALPKPSPHPPYDKIQSRLGYDCIHIVERGLRQRRHRGRASNPRYFEAAARSILLVIRGTLYATANVDAASFDRGKIIDDLSSPSLTRSIQLVS